MDNYFKNKSHGRQFIKLNLLNREFRQKDR